MNNWSNNPFLQHLFIGEFLEVPEYLAFPPAIDNIKLVQGTLFDVPDLQSYDLIQLSNISDWSSVDEIKATCHYLNENLRIGAIVLFRQINNNSPITPYLGENFSSHEVLAENLLKADRSLFYSNLVIVEKRK